MTTDAAVDQPALRRATVAFVDILGASRLTSVVGIERAYGIVTGCLRVLSGIVRAHGGVVDQYLSDALMAVFGYPIEGPNPEAASVEAATVMLAAARRWTTDGVTPEPLVLRIGINTGSMVAGSLRGPIAREFAVMGDVVNTAARLKDVGAAGCIHIGPETHAGAREHFAFETLAPLELRGKVKRVPTFRVLPPPDAARATARAVLRPATGPFVGRERDAGVLRAALDHLRAGRGGAIVVTGDEGIGKSRLLSALCAEADAAGLPVVLDDVPADGGPAVVVHDDLQHADAAHIARLCRAVHDAAGRPILWAFAWRPADVTADLAATIAAIHGEASETLALGPLPADDALRLVDATSDTALSPAARTRIVARAAGNPARLQLGVLLAPAIETELAIERDTVERSSEAERRQVTVLFADISGFTRLSEQLEPGQAFRTVSGCLRVLHEVAEKYGGTVDKYLGDCVMAMFGVPVAIEDAPRAAVNAAIEMLRRVGEYNVTAGTPVELGVHVGVNTGLGIAGDVSGPLLREFALMGDAVNVASRLKDVAPSGTIWVGGETARLTRSRFEYRAVPLPPKDGTPPADAFELCSAHEQVHRPRIGTGETLFAQLVGRDRELAALRGALSWLRDGGGGAAAVVGEPGLGKSRLLAELARAPEVAGMRWAEGRSIAMGRTLRFHPLVDLLRGVLDLGEHGGDDAWTRLATRARPLLGEGADGLPFLANLLGVPAPPAESERVAAVPIDVLERLQQRAVRELLLALSREAPLVVVLEDLHWADRSSIELLGVLLRLGLQAPILFLCAARPGFASTTDRFLALARGTLPPERLLDVRLTPLGPADVHRLLGTLFPPGSLPGPSRERIERYAGGNPLYVEELLRSLIEQGAIDVSDDGLRVRTALEGLRVPDTVQEVVLSRVDRLAPARKQLLQLAAVVGQRVAAPVLAELAPEPTARDAALAHLVDAQFLRREESADAVRYAFVHRLIQEVTYGSILETRRAALHGQVARVVEARMREGSGYHGLLAYHYGQAGDADRAEEHLFRAGDDAARAGAPAEALELFHESSRLYLARHGGGGDPAKRAVLHHRLAGAYFHRGELEDATRHFNEALALRGELVPRGRVVLGLGLARAFAVVLVDLYLRGAGDRRRPPATTRDLEVIELMFDRARAQTVADPTRFLFDSLETLRKLRGIDPATVPGAGGLYAGAIGIFSYGGVSFDVGRRFLSLAERYVDPTSVPETFLYRMMSFAHHFLAGDWDRRHEIPDALVDEAVRAGQLWDVATHLGLESFKRLLQGRYEDTAAHVERLAWIEETYSYDLARSNRHAALAFLAAERRDLDVAVEAAETYLLEHHEPLLNIQALGTLVKVHVHRGDLAAARTAQAKTDELAARGRLPPWHFGFVARGRLLLLLAESGDRRHLRRAVRDAAWAAARVAWLRPEVYRIVARAHEALGRTRARRQWLERAVTEADRLAMAPEAARARAELDAMSHHP